MEKLASDEGEEDLFEQRDEARKRAADEDVEAAVDPSTSFSTRAWPTSLSSTDVADAIAVRMTGDAAAEDDAVVVVVSD